MGILSRAALPFLLLCTLVSCGRENAYSNLDKTISSRADYVRSYQRECEAIRLKLNSSPTDSSRWYYADSLFWRGYDYSIDTIGKYSALQLAMNGTTPLQNVLSLSNRAYYLLLSGDESEAFSLFRSLDSAMFTTPAARLRYYKCGSFLYHKAVDPTLGAEESRRLEEYYAGKYIELKPNSLLALKLRAQIQALHGENRQALETLLQFNKGDYVCEYNELALVTNKIGLLYYEMGNTAEAKRWLTESAILDFKYPSRGYVSLYYLAEILFSEDELLRAENYITTTFEDMLIGGYGKKIVNSAKLGIMISSALNRAETRTRRLMVIVIVVLALLVVTMTIFLLDRRRKSRTLALAMEDAVRMNASLEEANKIMNSYVFRYMELALQYLDRMDQRRHSLLKLYKTDEEAFLNALRSPFEIYSEYKEFYATFDRIFLGIYPDFVEKVNSLMKKESRFSYEFDKGLSTELRILAAIKLGILDSQKISEFLRCSISTVYNYRAKMRNAAACPKKDFENLVRSIT